jgi:pimeloyl-ACP methyl ester carboxylesterase
VPLPRAPLGYAALAETLGPTLGLTADTVLLAESFSGPLAVMLAAHYPVAALVLCNSFVVPPRPPMLQVFALDALFRIRPPDAVIRRYFVGPAASDTLVARVQEVITSVPPAVLAARVRAVLGVDVADQLARCGAPIVYLRGRDDELVPAASLGAVKAAAANSVTTLELPGPHLLLQVAPEAAWEALRNVLVQLPAAQ